MKKNVPSFKVINWNPNSDNIEYYNVMPYLIECWKDEKKRKYKAWGIGSNSTKQKLSVTRMPKTFEEFKAFVLDKSLRFWCRCEYEILIAGWPQNKHHVKIDVYEQIEQNIDVLTKLFMDFILPKKK